MTTPPVILPRTEHPVSRKEIDENTLKVLYRLRGQGFKAYLVGGCVRDLLLNRTPKDFDVATDATPGQVKKLFRNCFLVGRRFRLAHVRFGEQVVEVATFRRQAVLDDLPEDPGDHHLFRENVFGTPEEDASRRDFTVNALFYDIETFAIIDFVGGLRDLRERRLRVIGDPAVRYHEDPVRMLRALEFAARLDFDLDPLTRSHIGTCAPLVAGAAPARVREELMTLFRYGVAGKVLREAATLGLLPPLLAGYTGDEPTFRLLDRLDRRTLAGGAVVTEGLALAALFLTPFLARSRKMVAVAETLPLSSAILANHGDYFHIAAGVRHQARELLLGSFRYLRGPGQRGERRFLQHPSARDSFALFRLWAEGGGDEAETVLQRWLAYFARPQGSGEEASPSSSAGTEVRRRRKRRRGGRGKKPAGTTPE